MLLKTLRVRPFAQFTPERAKQDFSRSLPRSASARRFAALKMAANEVRTTANGLRMTVLLRFSAAALTQQVPPERAALRSIWDSTSYSGHAGAGRPLIALFETTSPFLWESRRLN